MLLFFLELKVQHQIETVRGNSYSCLVSVLWGRHLVFSFKYDVCYRFSKMPFIGLNTFLLFLVCRVFFLNHMRIGFRQILFSASIQMTACFFSYFNQPYIPGWIILGYSVCAWFDLLIFRMFLGLEFFMWKVLNYKLCSYKRHSILNLSLLFESVLGVSVFQIIFSFILSSLLGYNYS